MTKYRICLPFWYTEDFEVEAESEQEAYDLVSDDLIKYSIDEEEHKGSLLDFDFDWTAKIECPECHKWVETQYPLCTKCHVTLPDRTSFTEPKENTCTEPKENT